MSNMSRGISQRYILQNISAKLIACEKFRKTYRVICHARHFSGYRYRNQTCRGTYLKRYCLRNVTQDVAENSACKTFRRGSTTETEPDSDIFNLYAKNFGSFGSCDVNLCEFDIFLLLIKEPGISCLWLSYLFQIHPIPKRQKMKENFVTQVKK